MRRITESHPGSGRFILSKIHVNGKDPIIHSKVMLVDDELALVGSTNIAQRSMCLCSEIHMAIIDEDNEFTRDLRPQVVGGAYGTRRHLFYYRSKEGSRRIFPKCQASPGSAALLPTTRVKRELPNKYLWNKFIDPYYGPKRD